MHTLSPTTLLSLALLTLTLTLPHPSTALTLRNTPAPPKPKCGDLDNAFWEMMHRYEFCEVIKKLPKRPQCGEGRKKCGVPGSHCTEEGVCSTACGVGRPECPRGFRCENGECEDFEEEGEGGSKDGGVKMEGVKMEGIKMEQIKIPQKHQRVQKAHQKQTNPQQTASKPRNKQAVPAPQAGNVNATS
ncbi:Vacuolar protein sorting-associated protein 1 [Venturia inaequalis]|nr:Vacuolar protein sorting-associated protein 1 [Venturia inaequalis]